jgi:hypothetical protein
MIDIYSAGEAHRNREIENIALIRMQYNVADAMSEVPETMPFWTYCRLIALITLYSFMS